MKGNSAISSFAMCFLVYLAIGAYFGLVVSEIRQSARTEVVSAALSTPVDEQEFVDFLAAAEVVFGVSLAAAYAAPVGERGGIVCGVAPDGEERLLYLDGSLTSGASKMRNALPLDEREEDLAHYCQQAIRKMQPSEEGY